MSEVTLVHSEEGDWVGVYRGSALLYEGHSVDPGKLLELLNIPHDEVWDWDGEAQGMLPDDLNDLDRPGEK